MFRQKKFTFSTRTRSPFMFTFLTSYLDQTFFISCSFFNNCCWKNRQKTWLLKKTKKTVVARNFMTCAWAIQTFISGFLSTFRTNIIFSYQYNVVVFLGKTIWTVKSIKLSKTTTVSVAQWQNIFRWFPCFVF